MVPRKKLDIGWSHLAFGLAACAFAGNRNALQQRLEQRWSAAGQALAFLSVRSGFDLLLQHLALPRGSEILVSAITIRDMVRIIAHHGLVAVPVDLDPATGAAQPAALENTITPDTRAIVIAHLFGSRMNMDAVASIAQRHRLFLFEDCAQAFAADAYRGHPGSDVAMFSFGTIKTATALGGALFNFRDAALRAAIAARQRCYPVQPRMAFLRKVMKIALLHALSCRLPYSIFVFMCRALGSNHDRLISSVVRGFPGDELMRNLRLQAPAALLALLDRRLRRCAPSMLEKRIASSMHALQRLPAQFHLGARAEQHSHWVFPIQSDHPDRLVCRLWQHGFDATRGASSLYAVPAPDGRAAAVNAQRMMDRVVYLPVESCASEVELQRMVQAVTQFAARPDSG